MASMDGYAGACLLIASTVHRNSHSEHLFTTAFRVDVGVANGLTDQLAFPCARAVIKRNPLVIHAWHSFFYGSQQVSPS
jgi:hypothetical protein